VEDFNHDASLAAGLASVIFQPRSFSIGPLPTGCGQHVLGAIENFNTNVYSTDVIAIIADMAWR
jgi:hypothetical protein